MVSNTLDLTVLMENNPACEDAVALVDPATSNNIKLRVLDPPPAAILADIQGNHNRIHVETVNAIGGADLVRFQSVTSDTLVKIGVIGDRNLSDTTTTGIVTDGGLRNRVIFEGA